MNKQVHISERIGLTKVVEGATHSKFSYTVENYRGLKTHPGGSDNTIKERFDGWGDVRCGRDGRRIVTEGVSVIVGVNVMVGDNVIVGTVVIVGR